MILNAPSEAAERGAPWPRGATRSRRVLTQPGPGATGRAPRERRDARLCHSAGCANLHPLNGGGEQTNTETKDPPHPRPLAPPGTSLPCPAGTGEKTRLLHPPLTPPGGPIPRGAPRAGRRIPSPPGVAASSPPEPLPEPPHGSGAGVRAGGLRAAPGAARAGLRARIGERAAAARRTAGAGRAERGAGRAAAALTGPGSAQPPPRPAHRGPAPPPSAGGAGPARASAASPL